LDWLDLVQSSRGKQALASGLLVDKSVQEEKRMIHLLQFLNLRTQTNSHQLGWLPSWLKLSDMRYFSASSPGPTVEIAVALGSA
jgi:hypothetical protein